MNHFWCTAADLPGCRGFSLFGPAHLCWLAAILVAAVLICRFSRRAPHKVSCALAWLLPASEVAKDIFLLLKGQFWAGNLPFYLCGAAMFLILLDSAYHCPFLLDVLYGLCLPGAVGALLFPDWTVQSPFGFFSGQSFVFHGLLVIYIVFQLAWGRRPRAFQGWWACALFLLWFAPLTKLLDNALGTNFLFLEAAPAASPLFFIQQRLGPWYPAGYALFGAVLVELMYLPLQLHVWRSRPAAQP